MKNTVLVVDDASFMRLSIKSILEQNGFEVVAEAADGREAIEKYREFQPDAIILDVVMPGMDGLEALREIKKEFPGARAAVCSAMGSKEVVINAVKAGAATFIVKPFGADLMVAALRKMLDCGQ